MKKRAIVATIAMMMLCLIGCSAAKQTVEFNGCSFEIPSGEIERMSDEHYTITLDKTEGDGDSYASISWNYTDWSEYEYVTVDGVFDAEDLEQVEELYGGDLIWVRSNIEEGRMGIYKTLRFDEVLYLEEVAEENAVSYSSNLRVQVHDKAYVTITFYASDKKAFDKHQSVVEEVFSSVKLV